MIDLQLLTFQEKLIFKKVNGQRLIYDPIRKKMLVQTPEETVRQLLLLYFLEEKKFNKNKIAVEKALTFNELQKRFDVLIYDRETRPWMLVECKAPSVPVTQGTFRQIAIYNMPLRVQYLLVTNGITTFCCEMDYGKESFTFLEGVPEYPGAG